MIKLEDVQRGYDRWAANPCNAKWVRKIDGTPIANDIVVNVFEALKESEGFALVPLKMTAAMINAWSGGLTVTTDEIAYNTHFQEAWTRVLSAAALSQGQQP